MEKTTAPAALAKSDAGFQLLFDQSSSAMAVWYGPPAELFRFNPAFSALSGYLPDAIGRFSRKDILHLVHPDDRQRVHESLCAWFKERTGQNRMEFRILTAAGQACWVLAAASFYHVQDQAFCLVIFQDVTGYKQAEMLRQTEKTQSLNRMAGAIAHHYNNLMAVIMGNLEIARQDLADGLNVVQNLDAAMTAARRISEMGWLMLAYLGQARAGKETLDLSRICRTGLAGFQANLTPAMTLESDLPKTGPFVRAGADQIQQVLRSLIDNAKEAMEGRSGSICLRVGLVSFDKIARCGCFPAEFTPKDGSYACIEISDQGCGVPEAEIDKIFDPFYSTKFTGRGMGLAVALGIVKAHEGCMTLGREPGGKTVFRVYLPATVEPAALQRSREKMIMPLDRPGTVLVVEDDDGVRQMVVRMLMMLKMKVVAARDGVEALEKFDAHKDEIRCVLCDLTMPRMDGWQTLEALRRISPDLPVILSSGYDRSQVLSAPRPHMPQAFLEKPYGIETLKHTLAQVMA